MIFYKNILNKFFVSIFLIITILIFNIVTVFAATPGNKNNVYTNIYSLEQYTSISSLLNDSGHRPSDEFVNNFLNDNSYRHKYIISYCNSGNCEAGLDNRSISFIGFNDDVQANFTQNGRELNINFIGDDDSIVYLFTQSGFLPESIEYTLSSLNRKISFWNFRCVLPVSNISNVNQKLPSLLFDSAFSELERNLKLLIKNHVDYLILFICIIIFISFVIHYLKRIQRYML